jgi:predicted phosphoribosyltransferase
MTFASRKDAGHKLGQHLANRSVQADVVLGLPRGGVVVAAEVAAFLQSPLDVLVVRKIGHPHFREFAVGALAEEDVVILDDAVLNRAHLERSDLEAVIAEESQRLQEYGQEFARPNRPNRAGSIVAIIDDGLATGATLEAAVESARKQGARTLVVAVPVASTSGARRIARACDAFHALVIDPDFHAVGQYYDSFEQTSDQEVQRLLGL